MNGASMPRPARPMSSRELAEMAEDFQFQKTIPFRYWARTADTLYQEAGFALEDGDLRKAYHILWRHSILVLKHLNTHPEAKSPESKAIIKRLRDRQNNEVFMRLEQLKPMIDDEYHEWKMMSESRRNADLEREEQRPPSYESFAARDPTLSGSAKVLDVGDNVDLAVDLAQNDYQRRDAARRGTRQAGVTAEEEHERRKGGRWDDWDGGAHETNDDEAFRRQMEATRRRLEGDNEPQAGYPVEQHARRPSVPPGSHARDSIQTYHYPSVSRPQPVHWDAQPVEPLHRVEASPAPIRPPKELEHAPVHELDATPPSRPVKEPFHSYKRLPTPEPVGGVAPHRPPKETTTDQQPKPPKKERITFRPSAYLENGDALRSVFIPTRLRDDFLSIAADNTRRGLEMCGILCGRPVNNALFVSCLLIPEQKCTSDTCETENESAQFDYCIQEDLLVIGWIHTHPTQTCFMSSRDLHTQAAYQVMMAESIAIVCAPRHKPSYGIFRLTNPPGLPHILGCTKSETFHMHDIDNIYTQAGHPPGHVYHSDQLSFYVHDLRPKR